MTGRQVPADEALALGLVNRVAPPDEVLDVALEWAAALARGPLVAHGLAKGVIDRGLDGTLADGLAVARTEDAGRGIASFAEHGPGQATFVGR
jgi:enoyl-CoA hydratase/carnithine racemase